MTGDSQFPALVPQRWEVSRRKIFVNSAHYNFFVTTKERLARGMRVGSNTKAETGVTPAYSFKDRGIGPLDSAAPTTEMARSIEAIDVFGLERMQVMT